MSSRTTCPSTCAFKENGCYAELGSTRLWWNKVTDGSGGIETADFLAKIAALPAATLWRHNVAGDLAGEGNDIDTAALADLVAANKGKRGFTYTHKPLTAKNLLAIKQSNAAGFTVNVSVNHVSDLDNVKQHGLPMVVVVDSECKENFVTAGGVKVVICPATIKDDVSCATCQMCQRQRNVTIGFPAHGVRKKVINIMLKKQAVS